MSKKKESVIIKIDKPLKLLKNNPNKGIKRSYKLKKIMIKADMGSGGDIV